ncbi:MAG TPA: M1 family aminopeptidase [Pseudomonadales bacterium]|nr:M1 family aminopeptidase [Pseudomonadales bacterium]
MARNRLAALVAAVLLTGCGEPAQESNPSAPAATTANAPAASNEPVTSTPTLLAAPRLQLPIGVTPVAYQLDLTVLPERETFTGRVRIDIRFDAATDGFWIHGRGLDVDNVSLRAADAVIPATYAQATRDGVVRISLEREIAPQTAQLDISYHGRFSNLLEGLYHEQVDGEWYAFTMFEPIDARGAFPGFDEPRFKTPFTLSIVAPKSATVAANTPVAEIATLPDGTKRVLFQPTQPLPTYLVAFAVGPLDVVEGARLTDDAASPLRGLARRGHGKEFSLALSNTPEIVALLADYFGQPYPFAKLDLVAVPSQVGAMENAGLITYGEYLMLLGDNPPLNQQRAFASAHAHELAHQWFGNSVTMSWWDDLWLNEAFATFMGSKIVQQWRPSYRAAEELTQSALATMDADGLGSARRIREPIESFNDITNAFDGITYQKGAGVLNMLEGFIGETAFRDGVRAHLARHARGSADMSDLVASLVESSGRAELGGIMKTFTELPGTPLVDVQLRCGAQEQPTVTLSQRRYLPAGSKADAQQKWDIPVCMRIGVVDGVREQCAVLSEPTMDVVLDGVDGCPNWVMPNRGGRGYYRWHLDETRLDRLTSVMTTDLDAGERLAVADSIVAGVEAGTANLAAFVGRLPQLLKSGERYLLMSPIGVWRLLQSKTLDDAGRAVSRARLRALYGPLLGALDKRPSTSDEDRLTRAWLMNVLAFDARDPPLRAELTRQAMAFTGFGADGQLHRDKLDVNLVSTALRVAAQDADAPFATDLASRLKDTSDPVLRFAFLNAIGSANDAALAQRLALDDAIRGDDYLDLLGSMFGAEEAERNWSWLSTHVDALLDKAPTFERSSVIHTAATYCSAERADAVSALFEPRLGRIDGGRRALDQVVERINLCVAFRTRYAEQARALFR